MIYQQAFFKAMLLYKSKALTYELTPSQLKRIPRVSIKVRTFIRQVRESNYNTAPADLTVSCRSSDETFQLYSIENVHFKNVI